VKELHGASAAHIPQVELLLVESRHHRVGVDGLVRSD
jgi:hypothetical protein